MLVSSAMTAIKRQFGDEYGVVINDDDIYSWMYSAELDIIRNSGSTDTLLTSPITDFPLALPLKTTVKRVYFTNVPNMVLTYTSQDQLDTFNQSFSKTGSPTHWYIEFNRVCLWPKDLVDARTITVVYTSVPVLMSGLPSANTFVVPDVYHDDIITYCVSKAHNKNNNINAERQMRDLYDKNQSLRTHEGDAADVILTKGADPWDWE